MPWSSNGKNKDTAKALAGSGQTVPSTYEGKVIHVRDNKLLMRIANGEERSHDLARDVDLSCDGEACDASNLKIGYRVRVTTNPDEGNIVIRIEAIDVDTTFSKPASGGVLE